jgi:hypothetical protein
MHVLTTLAHRALPRPAVMIVAQAVAVQKVAVPRAVVPMAVQPIVGALAQAAVRAVAISPAVPVMPDAQKQTDQK